MNNKILPFPEILTTEAINIRESQKKGDFNWANKTLTVPISEEEYDDTNRLQAMARLKWTPPDYQKGKRVRPEILEITEKARINLKLAQSNKILLTKGLSSPDVVKWEMSSLLKKGDINGVVKELISSYNTRAHKEQLALLDEYYKETAKAGKPDLVVKVVTDNLMPSINKILNSLTKIRGTYSGFQRAYDKADSAVKAAKYLQDFIDSNPDSEAGKAKEGAVKASREAAEEIKKALEKGELKLDEDGNIVLSDASKEGLDEDSKNKGLNTDRFIEALKRAANAGDSVGKWGVMNIETPALENPIAGYVAQRYTASESGTLMRNPHRWTSDQRIFTRKRLDKGGAVLIDCSGSMGDPKEMVKEIVSYAPGCTVALYSGNTMDGVLRIVAKAGRITKDDLIDRPAGGNNCIDYPALQWLAKQGTPRWWVSDGQVTGVMDSGTQASRDLCNVHNFRNGITRINSYKDGVDYFKKKRVRD